MLWEFVVTNRIHANHMYDVEIDNGPRDSTNVHKYFVSREETLPGAEAETTYICAEYVITRHKRTAGWSFFFEVVTWWVYMVCPSPRSLQYKFILLMSSCGICRQGLYRNIVSINQSPNIRFGMPCISNGGIYTHSNHVKYTMPTKPSDDFVAACFKVGPD